MDSSGRRYSCTQSLPSRERGLKYKVTERYLAFLADVAPFAGARIEIGRAGVYTPMELGRSLRGSED